MFQINAWLHIRAAQEYFRELPGFIELKPDVQRGRNPSPIPLVQLSANFLIERHTHAGSPHLLGVVKFPQRDPRSKTDVDKRINVKHLVFIVILSALPVYDAQFLSFG